MWKIRLKMAVHRNSKDIFDSIVDTHGFVCVHLTKLSVPWFIRWKNVSPAFVTSYFSKIIFLLKSSVSGNAFKFYLYNKTYTVSDYSYVENM